MCRLLPSRMGSEGAPFDASSLPKAFLTAQKVGSIVEEVGGDAGEMAHINLAMEPRFHGATPGLARSKHSDGSHWTNSQKAASVHNLKRRLAAQLTATPPRKVEASA